MYRVLYIRMYHMYIPRELYWLSMLPHRVRALEALKEASRVNCVLLVWYAVSVRDDLLAS